MNEFSSLGLSSDLVNNLSVLGFEKPTPIQAQSIPEVISGKRDVLGLARTGTGKTACFSLPILEQVDPHVRGVQALILAPTRELALQITSEIERLRGRLPIKVCPVYGGQSIGIQLNALSRNPAIVVGTPGRVIDLLQRKKLILKSLTHMVIDEADDMLSMGFIEDIRMILTFTPPERRLLLFSATMPRALESIVDDHMGKKLVIDLREKSPAPTLVEQIYFEVYQRDKIESMRRVIDGCPNFYGIVFCRTRVETDQVNEMLSKYYDSEALHGEMNQSQREKIVGRFRKKTRGILVATDVASRGFDTQGLTHVINYSLPGQVETYVHRIGRTGRAGNSGIAISLVNPTERKSLVMIQRVFGNVLKKSEPPSVASVVERQTQKIYARFGEAMAAFSNSEKITPMNKHWLKISQEIVESDKSPVVALAALFQMVSGDQLAAEFYPSIQKVEFSSMGARRSRPRFGGGGGGGPRRNQSHRGGGGSRFESSRSDSSRSKYKARRSSR